MAFAANQLKLLEGKLPEKYVKTHLHRGLTLSYIEGWHAIAEANRIFGFDGWDRETMQAECVWQDGRGALKLCSYTARVRIRVRAGETIIQRDGSAGGQGSSATLGEAHESALKEAETDATKRARTTFGNLFGLALYDRHQAGVRRAPRPRDHSTLVTDQPEPWVLSGCRGEIIGQHETVKSFCTGAQARDRPSESPTSLEESLLLQRADDPAAAPGQTRAQDRQGGALCRSPRAVMRSEPSSGRTVGPSGIGAGTHPTRAGR